MSTRREFAWGTSTLAEGDSVLMARDDFTAGE